MELYPWQQRGMAHLLARLPSANSLLDASDTGTGKTFTALATMKSAGVVPFIVCPKSVVTAWTRAALAVGVSPLGIVNVEKLKAGNTPWLKKGSGKTKWVWTLPRGSWIIWDEVQNASGYKSANGKVLAYTRIYGLKVLMLSATVGDSPLKLKAIGYLLGLHGYNDFFTWCLKNGCWQNDWNGLEFLQGQQRIPYIQALHKQIFPEKGIRARIADIPEFPDNCVQAEAYDLYKDRERVQAIYDTLSVELKNPDNAGNQLTVMLRARQQVELLKVPLIQELTEDALEEGKSVVIFVAFKETFKILSNLWPGSALIYGGQAEEDRTREIDSFQADNKVVCLCMVQAGGVGVSLNDINGNRPRESIITPGFNAVEIKQALGRIHRANSKSKSVQRLLFAAGTVEETACQVIKRKLVNISLLNDGDLTAGLIS